MLFSGTLSSPSHTNSKAVPLCLLLLSGNSLNIGSIVACSFMTTFFTLFDFLFDMIKPVKTGNCYATCFGPTLGWFHILGDLVRSDALALVAVNGSAYW